MYDPVIDSTIPSQLDYTNSWWRHSVTSTVKSSILTTDISTDVAIVGSGYTGLSCAYHLSDQYQVDCVVLEANQISWGASSRNAGFVLPSTGRLGVSALAKRYGIETTQKILQEYHQATQLVHSLIQQSSHDVEQQATGYLKIAHQPRALQQLKQQAEQERRLTGEKIEFLSGAELAEHYIEQTNASGAIRYGNGFGIHPLKLAHAYAELAQHSGVPLFSHSSVQAIEQLSTQQFILHTEKGSVRAKSVLLCTNGYTPKQFFLQADRRIFPVMSSIVVTRPLLAHELSVFKTSQVMMDTRMLKYYYRHLPGNRILFGGRGAVYGKHASNAIYQQRLLQAFHSFFPQLMQVEAEFFWNGWLGVSWDNIPHLTKLAPQVYFAGGYCGSGISFSTLMGKRLAQMVVGARDIPLIPHYQTALSPFPFLPFRRIGQQFYYQYGRFKDNMS